MLTNGKIKWGEWAEKKMRERELELEKGNSIMAILIESSIKILSKEKLKK